jgi:uncharacterized OB-fold protein
MPAVTPENEHFWTGGAQGKLQFLRCDDDGTLIHPPAPRCPKCLGKNVSVAAVSGSGTVFTFTINHQPWFPNLDPPYAVAIVVIDEQDDVRLTTNIVGCDPEDVFIGMRVRVTFEEYDGVWLPFFEPAGVSA